MGNSAGDLIVHPGRVKVAVDESTNSNISAGAQPMLEGARSRKVCKQYQL